MKTIVTSALVVLTAAFAGCRRKDFREHEFEIPGMTAANTNTIATAIAVYEGVDMDSLKWDLAKKILTVRFDSMKVARTNIRMAIEEKGVKVSYPKKSKDGVAGYLNERDTEVK